jgi:hypothetical protein
MVTTHLRPHLHGPHLARPVGVVKELRPLGEQPGSETMCAQQGSGLVCWHVMAITVDGQPSTCVYQQTPQCESRRGEGQLLGKPPGPPIIAWCSMPPGIPCLKAHTAVSLDVLWVKVRQCRRRRTTAVQGAWWLRGASYDPHASMKAGSAPCMPI